MTAKTELRILLLGTPVVYTGDQPLQIQRRMLRWMLFFLACQKDMVGRADLILLFWPDAAEEDGRRHLRELLSKLRTQLPDPDLIVTEQDRVGLDLSQVFSDVLEFESLAAQTARACAQTPAATPLTQAVYQKVGQAIRLWRSERFLAGATLPESEALNDWLFSTGQQLETQRQRLLERLADHDVASGDIEGAIDRLHLALEGDETNETLHYRLLNMLHSQGRYSEALTTAPTCRNCFGEKATASCPLRCSASRARSARALHRRRSTASGHPGPPWLISRFLSLANKPCCRNCSSPPGGVTRSLYLGKRARAKADWCANCFFP